MSSASVRTVSRVTPANFERRSVVVLRDVTTLSSQTDASVKRFVEQGGGLFVVLAENSPWSGGDTPLLPGTLGPRLDAERRVEITARDAGVDRGRLRPAFRLTRLDLDLLEGADARAQIVVLGGHGGDGDAGHEPLGLPAHEHEAVDHQPEHQRIEEHGHQDGVDDDVALTERAANLGEIEVPDLAPGRAHVRPARRGRTRWEAVPDRCRFRCLAPKG